MWYSSKLEFLMLLLPITKKNPSNYKSNCLCIVGKKLVLISKNPHPPAGMQIVI